MQLLLVTMALLGIAPAGQLSAAPQPAGRAALNPSCPDDPAAHLARSAKDGQFRKLGELPPADVYAAVYRRGPDGCMIPVMYRELPTPPAPALRR
jgi:hypothetical protein